MTALNKKLPAHLISATLSLFILAGCKDGILAPAGPVGAAERTILFDCLAVMLTIVVPTILAVVIFAWWFRATNMRARYRSDWAYSGQLELLVWSIPALVVLFLGGIAWTGAHDLDPAQPIISEARPLELEVISLDWKWLFIYPDQNIASLNHLVVPVGMPLHLHLTSASVMNVFFVPRLGSEIYTMNGMVTQLNLKADTAGAYHGLSAHFSGDGFSDMGFTLEAVKADGFSAWVAATKTKGLTLDAVAYSKMLVQSQHDAVTDYGNVRPGLFDDIVAQRLPPGDGPALGKPDPAASPRQEK